MKKINLSWKLFGQGMENFGENGAPSRDAMPVPGDDEILVRVEALGLCFSDIKIIRAGASHPKLWEKDLKTHPLIPGHEAVFTIVGKGKNVPDEFYEGRRCLIQCDIFVGGRSCAYGYGMPGGMTQYSILDKRVWAGEGRSYLLDWPDGLSAAAAALIEPWTCVRASAHITHRAEPLKDGKRLFVFGNAAKEYVPGDLFERNPPAVCKIYGTAPASFQGEAVGSLELEGDFDDIVCCDVTDPEVCEKAVALAGQKAVITFAGATPCRKCAIDLGALHYQNRFYQGTMSLDLSDAYRAGRRMSIKPGGTAWFFGGAGAMGQMHVELAAVSPGHAGKILVSDLDDARLEHLQKFLGKRASELGVECRFVNPSGMSAAEFDRLLREFAPEGFDDILLLVPSAECGENAASYLGRGGLMNVFAGIPAGDTGAISIRDIVENHIRFTGSSGSSTDDMIDTVRAAAEGEFLCVSALGAIGGMKDLKKGLEKVASGAFPGKTVIFPNCPDLPLTAMSDLAKISPDLPATLDANGFYTAETEQKIFAAFGEREE